MIKIRKNFIILFILILLIPVIKVKALEDFLPIDDTTAKIKGNNYTIDEERNVITLTSNAQVELTGNANYYKIIIDTDAQNVSITLNNFTTSSPEGSYNYSPFELKTGSDVSLTLIGENTLKAGQEASAIRVPENTSLEINGKGTLYAESYNQGSSCFGGVIGGEYNQPFGNITINSGNIYTNYYTSSGKSFDSGIGNGYCSEHFGQPIYPPKGTITLNGGHIHTGVLGYVITDSEEKGEVVLKGNGSAIVYAENNIDNLNSEEFNGIIFDKDGNGIVKGNVTLTDDLEITGTLIIEEGATLNVPEGVTVTNNGTIVNNGSIKNTGTINNKGNIDNTNGTIESASNIENIEGNDIKPIKYNIFIKVGPGGTINSNPYLQIEHGQNLILNIFPNNGYKIKSVLVNNLDKTNEVKNGTIILEHITQDTEIEISFEKIPSQPETTFNTESNNCENHSNIPKEVKNPQTSDSLIKYVVIQLVSLLGLINSTIYLKRHF